MTHSYLALAMIIGAVCISDGATAETKMHACSLLTSDEVGAAMDLKVGSPRETDTIIPSGLSKGETLGNCGWRVGETGMVSVSIIRAPNDAKAGMALLNRGFEGLKAQGWREERKPYGNSVCVVMTPPPGKTDLPISTGCMGQTKGMGVSVGAMGTKRIEIEKVKMLFDKAVDRVP